MGIGAIKHGVSRRSRLNLVLVYPLAQFGDLWGSSENYVDIDITEHKRRIYTMCIYTSTYKGSLDGGSGPCHARQARRIFQTDKKKSSLLVVASLHAREILSFFIFLH